MGLVSIEPSIAHGFAIENIITLVEHEGSRVKRTQVRHRVSLYRDYECFKAY